MDFELVGDLTPEQKAGALISECGRYRYRLWRMWNMEQPVMVWCLLNPSTANGETDDHTVRRCISLARRNGYGGIIIVNCFALRSTNPKALRQAHDPVGPENDEHITWACRAPILSTVVAGWGTQSWGDVRIAWVRALLRAQRRGLVKCFGKTDDGSPRHPSRLPDNVKLEDL